MRESKSFLKIQNVTLTHLFLTFICSIAFQFYKGTLLSMEQGLNPKDIHRKRRMACTGTLLVHKNNLSCIGQSGKIKLRVREEKWEKRISHVCVLVCMCALKMLLRSDLQ